MKYLIGLFLSLGFVAKSYAQNRVQDESFDKMLQVLLSHDVSEISTSELMKFPEMVIVDAREKKEFQTSHIENSIWVGYNDFNLGRLSGIGEDQKIIVYCSVGYRSEKIARKLMTEGFTNVFNLYGGIFEWVNQGNEVVDKNGKTDKVHTYNRLWSIWLKKGNKIY